MEILIPVLVALCASLLTFFSGFGLGTILLPAFLLFYPVELAIGMTAIVHLLNGLFKTGLIGRHASMPVLLHFGIPAIIFAFLGAWLLTYLSGFPMNVQYKLAGIPLATSPVKLVIGLMLLIFAIVEILPLKNVQRTGRSWLWLGGVLSGFFGGLSGHQGALRSAFLIRIGLSKESFIATGILISLCIDLARLPVYLSDLGPDILRNQWMMLAIVTLAAFAGAYLGRKLLKKVTLHFVQYMVAVAVALIGIFLALGKI